MRTTFANYPSLAGKTVFVTGGASGIGAEIARGFSAQGALVGFVDLDRPASAALAEELGGETAYEICDLRDIAALKAAFTSLQAKLGNAAVLVNNAARDDRHNWNDVTPEYWDDRLNTNLRHFFFAMQAVAPGMIAAGGGSIINLGSNSWWEAFGGFPAYATAKAAVHGLTRTMARDLGQHRIRVNTVVPGWVMTERQKTLWATPEAIGAHRKRQCLPDLIEPVYIARMVLFLASDDAKMCTANNYMVEAGSI
ncbi:MAG: SDR family oxidoreductase [Aestuariivirga sp.]